MCYRFASVITGFLVAYTIQISGTVALGQSDDARVIDRQLASEYFSEAAELFAADGGALWGKPLDGPMLFVEPRSKQAVANMPAPEGGLQFSDRVYVGQLPQELMIANTAVKWNGAAWTMLLWPLPDDKAERGVLLAHEAWHRIQDDLGFPASNAANSHLDTLLGRYYLQLEWRALASALELSKEDQSKAITDALAFRRYRQQLFETAALEESAMEMHEGLAEYTGVRLALDEPSRRARTAKQLKKQPAELKTFVRSFAYLSGPAYGLLLEQNDASWLRKLNSNSDFGQLLQSSFGVSSPSDLAAFVKRRQRVYDPGDLWLAEKHQDDQRREALQKYKTQFESGPRLVVPLKNMNMSFNPNELVPIEGLGTVYPTLTVSDDWGLLRVTGGALITDDFMQIILSVPRDYDQETESPLWRLELKGEWSITKSGPNLFELQPTGDSSSSGRNP